MDSVKEKKKQLSIDKFGVENVFQAEEIKNTMKKTSRRKYNCDFPSQNLSVKAKMKSTLLARYGVEFPLQSTLIKNKAKETCFKHFGVLYSLQSPLIRDKIRQTCQARYGCDNPFQDPVIFDRSRKNAFRRKEYILPSGEKNIVQGYEPFALDELFKIYLEEDICIETLTKPRIEYFVDSKKHYYFPDIYIPKENKIIEVKSTWTYKLKPDIIKLKGVTCKEQGYNYEIWKYDNKRNKEVIIF
jgi:hypothetical protein